MFEVMFEKKTLFGLPVLVTDAVAEDELLVGSMPEPERPDMTIEEYAQQCAKYFRKIKLDTHS